MSDHHNASDVKDERIRLLEYQVDFLRGEVEFVTRQYERAIYSASWHLAWPFRFTETLVRRFLAARPAIGTEASAKPSRHASPTLDGNAVTANSVDIAAHIARRGQPEE